jgi:hypothetical protein
MKIVKENELRKTARLIYYHTYYLNEKIKKESFRKKADKILKGLHKHERIKIIKFLVEMLEPMLTPEDHNKVMNEIFKVYTEANYMTEIGTHFNNLDCECSFWENREGKPCSFWDNCENNHDCLFSLVYNNKINFDPELNEDFIFVINPTDGDEPAIVIPA